jgi:hypothetical protein
LVKLNERLTTLQSQQQQQQQQPPPSLPSRPSLHRQISPNIPSRLSPLPTWSNPEFQEPDFSRNSLPPTMPDRPRLKDYLAAMKPDTWGSGTGRPSKRSSINREENMYIPPPLSNIPDNSNFYTNTTPSTNPLYSTGPAHSPRQYPTQAPVHSEQHSLSYQQPPVPTQSVNNQPQMLYNPPNTQPFTQQNYSSQPSLRQPSPTRHPGYQPPPPQQQVYQPPPPQQQVYQPPPPQQQVYQPPALQQQVYQPPPPQQQVYQPPPPQQSVYQPPPPQQQMYQPPPPQQQVYQPPPSQQSVYQPPPPQQQMYQPPPPQQQVYQPPPQSQQVYQPPHPQQSVYQPPQQPSFQQPIYQSSSIQQPTHPSFVQQPAVQHPINQQHTGQPTQVNPAQQPTSQQSLPPAKFDPYRPQPVGAYDIPKPQNPPVASQTPLPPPAQQQQQQQQTIPTQPRVAPQDVYRPGGLYTTNPQPTQSFPTNNNNYDSNPQPTQSFPTNNNNYDPNQYVQYVPTPRALLQPTPTPPPPPPSTPVVPSSAASTAAKLPANSVAKQPSMPNILDDLLSLALEQQANTSTIDTEPNSPEPQSPISVDEEPHIKSNGKPIACIQPLPMVTEEKQVVQPIVTPTASLSPPQDPYGDKEKLDQLVSDVQRFEKHVSTMTKKTLNGTIPLEVDWKVSIKS